MIGHVDKALKCLLRIGGDVGSSVVDRAGVGTSVPEPCVDDHASLLQRAKLRRTEFALVHVLSFLLVLVCASIVPHDALAMTTDIGDGLDVDGVSFRDAARIVYPYKYDGNDPDQVYEVLTDYIGFDWSALSASVKDKLKNEGGGDNPFSLAARNNVQNLQYGSWKLRIIDIQTHPIQSLRLVQLMGTYGMDALWLVDMTQEYKEQVTRYFLKWALPHSDTPVTQDGNTYTVDMTNVYADYEGGARFGNGGTRFWYKDAQDNVYAYCTGNGQGTDFITFTKKAKVTFTVNSSLNLDGYDTLVYFYAPSQQNYRNRILVYVRFGKNMAVSQSEIVRNVSSVNGRIVSTQTNVSYDDYYYDTRTVNLTNELDVGSINLGTLNLTHSDTSHSDTLGGWNGYVWGSTTQNVVYEPTPDQPTPAPVEPSDPTYDPPAADTPVTWPTIHLPDFNFPDISISIPTIQYEGTDYTQWLKQIDDDIRSYGHDILYGISDFYDAFGDYAEDTSVLLADISRTLQAMGNEWTLHCDHITDEIYDGFYGLKSYIGSQCKYIVGTIKSETKSFKNEIVKWLKLIYNRLKGRSTTQPSIDDDEPGFWDWIGDILNGLINKLIDGLPDELLDLLQDFEELTSYFPVSIPWDIAAALALLAHEPVTPAFPIDWVGSEMYGIELHVVIDLTPWNEYAELFRQIQFVAFVIGMLFFTMEQLDIFGIISSKVSK